MKLSFSNIAWSPEQDEIMYQFLQDQKFAGLEIAPTRIFPDKPYDRLNEAGHFAGMLRQKYELSVPSIQSIWYGRNENIFGSDNEYGRLIEYTKKAVDFAAALHCGNLVFGCPKNRNKPNGADLGNAYRFFTETADYAILRGTTIALEPNPPIYGTNFINRTEDAFHLANDIKGLSVNVDFGAVIANSESLQIIADHIKLVNHVHISEPNLAPIKKNRLHRELCAILKHNAYDKYVSVEMKNPGDIETVMRAAEYTKEVFS